MSETDKNYELAKGIVSDVVDQNPLGVKQKVDDLMVDKVRDAIAGHREKIAQSMFGEPEVEEPEIDIEDIEDDEQPEESEPEVETETEEEDENIQGDQ